MLVTPKVRLVHELREGGMGTVWVAEHLTLETRVAVKFVSPELVRRSERVVERFQREAKAAAKLRSPHVVTIHDYGVTDDGVAYLVMELLEGETLGERLARSRLSPADVAVVVSHTAKALDEAHALGIVHRDIKPSNLFLTCAHDELFIKVLDFGIAKAMDRTDGQLTLTEGMVGTLHYMSPEQLTDAAKVGPSADLWSLAVVAYHALTGKLPFEATSPVAIHKQIVSERFTAPSTHLGDDPELDAWFRKAFALEPMDRHGSVRELASTLAQVLAGTESRPAFTSSEPPEGASAELGTAEFVAELERQQSGGAGASSDADEEPYDSPSGEHEMLATGEHDDVVAHQGRAEPSPPSTTKRRRSTAVGMLFGVALATIAVLAYRLANDTPATDSPPPPAPEASVSLATAATVDVPVPAAPPSATASIASAPPPATRPPGPAVWPIGCTAAERPCGIGCCIWEADRGCEPGSCEQPLAPDAPWDLRLAKIAVWPTSDKSKLVAIKKPDVWVRFGSGKVRQPLFANQPLRVTSADFADGFGAWLQPNTTGLPPVIEFAPRAARQARQRLVICRGLHLSVEAAGFTYWLWISVLPAGEPVPELCAKARP